MEPSKSTIAAKMLESDQKFTETQSDPPNMTSPTLNSNLVDFTNNDPENPVDWSSARKRCIVIPVAIMSFLNVFATCAIIPAAPLVMDDFRESSSLYQTLLVSIWELGEGIGPLLVAPLAEKFGRAPIFHIGNAFCLIWLTASALSTTVQMLIAFRFLSGFSSTTLTLGPAIIGDLFILEQRGGAMAVVMGMTVLGTFLAPICGSFVAASFGWRWTIWICVIAIGTLEILCVLVIHETYSAKILARKVARLQRETGIPSLRSKYQTQIDDATFTTTITRPLTIMIRSPIVLLISLYTAIAYGLMYLAVTTLTPIMESQYSFSHGTIGLAFLAFAIGNLTAILFYGLTSDAYIKYRKAKQGNNYKTESRLIHMVYAAALLPLAFVFYGWTLRYHLPWAVPLVGSGFIGFGLFNTQLSTETYLVDAYPLRSASAVAAGVILRAILGAVYPLSGPPLYDSLGLGWGNTVLGFVLLAFLPFLLFLVKYGEKLRRKENHTSNY